MKMLALSGLLFMSFIFLYESGQFLLAWITGGLCLFFLIAAIVLGKKTGSRAETKG